MKKYTLLCILLQLSIAAQSQVHYCRLPQSFEEENTSIDTSGFDVKKYKLEIAANPTASDFSGKTTIYFTSTANLNNIILDAGNTLTIQSVELNGLTLSDYNHSDDKLKINLPSSILANTSNEIAISYIGLPSSNGGYMINQHNGTPMVYTFSESFAAPLWWVCKDNLQDKADEVELLITHPQEYKSVANGLLISSTDNQDGTVTDLWQHKYAIPTYLIAFAVTNYEVYSNYASVSGIQVPVINYVYPESLTDDTKTSLDKVPGYIEFLSRKYGDYPYKNEKYGHAQWQWNGGMEHATVSFVKNFTEDLVIHELMHQWFGDKVTCATWHDIWLNEGFATYGVGLLKEYMYGQESFKAWKSGYVKTITQLPDGSVYNPDASNENRIFDNRLTYLKGALVINQIRFKLGDSLYFKAMNEYLDNPAFAYGSATTEDFKQSLKNSTGTDFTEFFNDWIYGEGYPIFNISLNQTSGKTSMKVSQTSSHSSVSFFETPFDMMFISPIGETYTRKFDLTENNQVFEFDDVPFLIKNAVFNPNSDIIAKTNNIILSIDNISSENIIYIYPNPVDNILNISASKKIKDLQIFDLTGKRIIYMPQVNDVTYTTDLSSLPTGCYLLRTIMEDGEILNDKILKK